MALTCGAFYFFTIVDDFSRSIWIYLLSEKREVANTLKIFMTIVQTQFDKTIKVVRSDNGAEFICLKNFLVRKEFCIRPDLWGKNSSTKWIA